ncbi:MAG: hypothetical protein A2X94_14470 [Bdellovibrionales bacterium GWB1_55_8]|nr:MAG: hypothetical protein A2X94_14470 [Bdellovibrionales bacterium GWB1_55_8]
MDHTHLLSRSPVLGGLKARIFRLPNVDSKLLQRWSRISGPLLIVTAVLLGAIAHRSSQQSAIKVWEEEHAPAAALVQATLLSQGFRTPENSNSHRRKALRLLPPGLETSGTLWASANRSWIAYFDISEINSAGPLLLCSDCKTAPTGWVPAGQGWKGFEEVLRETNGRARQGEKQARKSSAARKPGISPLDSREIRY